jgi:hypothetical protein
MPPAVVALPACMCRRSFIDAASAQKDIFSCGCIHCCLIVVAIDDLSDVIGAAIRTDQFFFFHKILSVQ